MLVVRGRDCFLHLYMQYSYGARKAELKLIVMLMLLLFFSLLLQPVIVHLDRTVYYWVLTCVTA